jgi:hypothetical protein
VAQAHRSEALSTGRIPLVLDTHHSCGAQPRASQPEGYGWNAWLLGNTCQSICARSLRLDSSHAEAFAPLPHSGPVVAKHGASLGTDLVAPADLLVEFLLQILEAAHTHTHARDVPGGGKRNFGHIVI